MKSKLITIFMIILLFINGNVAFAEGQNLSSNIKNDEKFVTYPYTNSRLAKERVIIKTDEKGKANKIYVFNTNGKLERIHILDLKMTLFIEKYGEDGIYVIVDDNHNVSYIYRPIGGTFSMFNETYRGGSGLSDVAVEDTYINKTINITNQAISKLKEAMVKFKQENGRMITDKEFNQPVNVDHPLMKMQGMNLLYFFDGHGARLVYRSKSDNNFELTSIYNETDEALRKQLAQEEEQMGEAFTEIGNMLLSFFLKVLFILFLFLVMGMATWAIFYFRRKMKNRK